MLRLRSTLPFTLLAAAALLHPFSASGAESDAASIEFFEKKIRPALIEHCYKCHSAKSEKIKGKLRVDNRNALQRGGETGPGIVPGDPEKSLIIEAIVYKNPDLQMPPDNKLPDEMIQDFIAWVKKGAVWPNEKETHAVVEEKKLDYDKLRKEHWAFQPLKETPPPAVKNAAWPQSPIDNYIAAALEAKNLQPGQRADKRRLLRRVSFDLTGLPPTPEQIDSFINDESPNAFEKVVDRLLASPHFGERWGRHWLDLARYAESAGGGRIVPLNNAWRYREYVINAFNKDKPYDRFIREQLAGDLLPATDFNERGENIVATGFLAIGPKNLDTQDKDLLRMDVVDEQIDTIGKVMLGMTIGCARCHDHKFDPITTREYYALAGIFRSTKTLTPGNVSGVVQSGLPLDAEMEQKIKEHDKIVAALEQKLHSLRVDVKANAAGKEKPKVDVAAPPATVVATAPAPPPTGKAADAEKKATDPASLPGIVLDDSQANIIGSWIKSTYMGRYVGEGYIHDNNKQKGEMIVSFAPTFAAGGLYEVRVSYTSTHTRADNVPVIVQYADGEKTVTVNQRIPPPIDNLYVSIGTFPFSAGNDGSVTISNTGTNGHVIVDSVQFISVDPASADTGKAVAVKPAADKPVAGTDPVPAKPATVVRTDDQEKAMLDKLEKEITELKKKAPVGPVALAVKDEEQTGDYNVCIRGDVHRLGQPVQRGFLALAPFPSQAVTSKQSGRIELADWITDPRNPLTSRVMVNRVWHHLFGAGLVRSTDNFGLTGETPSHPELLDYLARQFVAKNWSIKQLVRSIVLSSTYQVSGAARADAAKVDPDNRLLARYNRRRLDVEALRDAMLANSGQLDLTPPTASLLRLNYEKPKANRRTVYMPIERETIDSMLEVFDFADPNLVVGVRNTSILATQALFFMNSPFAVEQSREAAKRLVAEAPAGTARIQRAYARALGRPPSAEELKLAENFLANANGNSPEATAAWAQFYQALFACVDFRFID
ncbi:MAG TPA: DUF1553 domain-containing protein [Planctomycetota bacterium]|nr:DUF1553 domain-containing protein [Planctomycetota bacterium]